MAAPRQVPVTLEEVTVLFSAEEWALLEEWQRELHREVTAATARLLASLGEDLALLSGAADADGARDAAAGQEPQGPPSSTSLCAMVRLVRDIPQFLFGSSNGTGPRAAAIGDTAQGSELLGAGGEAQVAPEHLYLDVLGRAAPSWHGSPSNAAPVAPQWGRYRNHSTGGTAVRVHYGVKPEVLARSSPLRSLERCLEELPKVGAGPPRTSSSATSIGHSPLQGLLDCLRAITIPVTSRRSPLRAAHGTRGAVEPNALRSGGQNPSAAGKALVTPSFHRTETSKWTRRSTSIGDTGTEEQRGLEMSPALEEAPLRSLLRCLRAVAEQAPPQDPVGAALALSGAEASPQRRPSAGTTESAVWGDTCPSGSTWPLPCVPAKGTATKRPSTGSTKRSPCSTRSASARSAALGAPRATSPPGSSAHPGGVPTSPREHCGCGGSLELQAEVAQLRTVVVEKLHRLRRDMGTAQREVSSARNRLARLERGARGRARDVAALIRSRRRLRDAIRRLEGRCWALESRAWHGSRALPDAVTILQMVLPAVLGLAMPRCGSGAAGSSAAPQGLGAL